ncbi:ATP-binding cassette domain-containing protein [Variovorax sp. J2P1-59]|uniref:ABC transporter permease subunit n=1 Tax=Variovorax flavidus TaxID=3053501 RepID=UPI002576B8C8|nr:ATP-binding cassette domain-containing protein [Variovorax sp. J2P1-59]MDM0078732.1 ATP-binding cassette domain-containing protein [Variovorax sp. J2P1-59]
MNTSRTLDTAIAASGPVQTASPAARRRVPWWFATVAGTAVLGVGAFFVDEYLAYLASSWLIFGLLGLSLDMVWGRGGMLSLGQTAFFGLGGYAGSVVAINFAGITGNTLVWLLPVGALVGAGAAGAVGWLLFHGKLGALQATILTYTVTLLLWTGSVSFSVRVGDAVVGGDNGLSNIPGMVAGFGSEAQALGPQGTFVCVLVLSALVLLGVRALLRSPFGTLVDCVRLNSAKTELLGYDVRRCQLVVFTLAGAIAGLAGALYGAWANYLNPSLFSAQQALLVPIYVLVGGLGTLAGPFVGAVTVGGLSYWLGGGVVGGQTTLIMGVALILLVLFMRGGLLGGIGAVHRRLRPAPRPGPTRQAKTAMDVALVRRLRDSVAMPAPVLDVRDAVKRFGGVVPVNRVTQTFAPGRVRCLIGPNGAGKSSLLRCLTGTHLLDAGTVALDGSAVTRWMPHRRVQAGVGIKMQVAQVFEELSVRTNLWIAAYSRDRSAANADRLSAQTMRALGLDVLASRTAADLSHGEQQWLDLGMVLCLQPSVVLLDEPAAGMTGDERRELSQLVRVLAETSVVVVVEHDMAFVRTLDAEVTVLHRGEVFAQGDLDTLRQDERILDIYLGRQQHVRSD